MSELLPDSWVISPIESVTTSTDQRTPTVDENFTYIDISSVDRDRKCISSPQQLTGKDAPSRARKVVRSGDVLVSMTRPNLNAVAMVPRELDNQIASTGFDVLRGLKIDPRWLYYLVRTNLFIDSMSSLVQGALYPAVKSKDVRSFRIPVAPLNEQKRIADKLDSLLKRVDACRERLDNVPAILKRFRQAVLAAATSGVLTEDLREGESTGKQIAEVSEPYTHSVSGPLSWRQFKLGEVCEFIGGSQPPKATFQHKEGPGLVRLIQIRDYKSDKFKTFIPVDLARRFCTAEDVMIGRYGPPIFQILRGLEGAYNVALMKAVPQEKILVREYLYYLLKNEPLLRYVEAGSDRTAGQDGVRKGLLNDYPVFLPNKEEQREIVRRIDKLFTFADNLEARYATARKKVENLTPSLLAKAFRGELVEQDPNDEPASVLLERIKAERAADGKQPRCTAPRRTMKKVNSPAPDPLPIAAEPVSAYGMNIPQRILAAMKLNQEYSRADLLAAAGISQGAWLWAIRQLKNEGLVLQTGERRGAKYQKR